MTESSDSGKQSSSGLGLPLPVFPYSSALLIVVLVYWSVDIVSPALPAIREHFGLNAAGAGLVFSLMFLGRLAGNIPATWMLGRSGAPLTSLLGAAVLGAGSLIVAFAPATPYVYAGRIVQGAGISLVVNAALRSILRSRPAEGAAMTWFGIGATAGGIFGLTASGILTEEIGWRAVFFFSAGLAAVIVGLSILTILRSAKRSSRMESQTDDAEEDATSLRQIAIPLLVNLIVFANYSIWVVLPLYAQHRFGATAERTATLLMVITVVHLVAALPVGQVIRRFGSPPVMVSGMLLALVGTALVPLAPSLIWLVPPLVVYGVGQVASVNAGGDIVLRQGRGTNRAVGYVRLSSDLGLVLGPVLAGALADWFGYQAPFIALPVLLAGAVILAVTQMREARIPAINRAI